MVEGGAEEDLKKGEADSGEAFDLGYESLNGNLRLVLLQLVAELYGIAATIFQCHM